MPKTLNLIAAPISTRLRVRNSGTPYAVLRKSGNCHSLWVSSPINFTGLLKKGEQLVKIEPSGELTTIYPL